MKHPEMPYERFLAYGAKSLTDAELLAVILRTGTAQMSAMTIETLSLSVRSYNALKRAGFNTIGELAKSISSGEDLKRIRNCGAKSIREIMEQLFLYQYASLKPEQREDYLLEVVALNVYHRDIV